ncbi:DNA internalization-related competence protein ComEC/Rec2 [Aquisalimonas sp. 2447]|uniref:DNA internalization-related competence protein ComEC/Rec2 n=1 Tax=Aquisalimonas sp. 2447 TaxID=2740807 RepID=UPI0014324636|nr:DNA internalization-related competence protein ComEC/Rec2 [Aquisalimonas sp. 2447]QIT55521.1 DNA internalization-related competence protein ComEC/Rec2 [Aquisalimonas sp. 2447]
MSAPLLICSAFTAGAIAFHLARTLPQAPFWALVLGVVAFGVAVRGRWLAPAAVCAGLAWSALHATLALEHRLEAPRDVTVNARVTDLVQHGERYTRFVVRFPQPDELGGVRRAQLIWYGVSRPPAEGEHWRLELALRPPDGRLNPGSFDRERWLITRRLDATGTVVDGQRLAEAGLGLDQVRASLSRQLRAAVNHEQAGAMLAALGVGDRRFLDSSTWDALLHTGTNHLVAISGLHVGLAGGLGLLLGTWGWRLLGVAARIPAPVAGAVVGLVTASTYAALAGFTIPTQRALLMLAVVLLAVAARRPARPLYLLVVALTGVLLIDPLAPLASGFWLSFAAVACLGLLLRGTPGAPDAWRWPALQLQLGIAIVPLTLALFGHAAVLAPVANLVAIPLVGLFAVPLTLLASALVVLAPEAGAFVAELAAWVLWLFLAFVDALHNAAAGLPRPGVPEAGRAWVLLAACSLLVLLPGAITPRLLAFPLATAVLTATHAHGTPEEWRATVLDVGHGHATVLESSAGVAVVDAGRRGDAVNALLARRAPGGADGLVLTRDQAGHRGGAEHLYLHAGAWRAAAGDDRRRCEQGDTWQQGAWEASLRFLDGLLAVDACLLLIQGPSATLLLATGLEPGQAIQWDMLPPVDAVVLPAAGHRDAVSPAMLDALAPKVAIVSVDAPNRHGLPHPETVARLERRGVEVLITGRDGAVELVARDGLHISPRRQHAGWWNRR